MFLLTSMFKALSMYDFSNSDLKFYEVKYAFFPPPPPHSVTENKMRGQSLHARVKSTNQTLVLTAIL